MFNGEEPTTSRDAQFCGDYDTFCIDRKYPKNNKAG